MLAAERIHRLVPDRIHEETTDGSSLCSKALVAMDCDRAPAGDEPDHQRATHRRQVIAALCDAPSEIPKSPDAALTVLARATHAGLPLDEQRRPGGALVDHTAGLQRSTLPRVVEDPRPESTAPEPPKTPAQRRFATTPHTGAPSDSISGCPAGAATAAPAPRSPLARPRGV